MCYLLLRNHYSNISFVANSSEAAKCLLIFETSRCQWELKPPQNGRSRVAQPLCEVKGSTLLQLYLSSRYCHNTFCTDNCYLSSYTSLHTKHTTAALVHQDLCLNYCCRSRMSRILYKPNNANDFAQTRNIALLMRKISLDIC